LGWIYVEVTGGDGGGGGFGGGGGDGKPEINITPSFTYKVYDGKYLYPQQKVDADRNLSELLDQGYRYEVSISGSQLEVGTSASVIDSFVLYDPNGKDVTDQYIINTSEGVLKVLPKDKEIIKIYLYQLQKYYDGTPLRYEEGDYEIIEMPDGLTLKISFNIELTDVGAITLADINKDIDKYITYSVYDGNRKVTSNYSLVCDMFETTDSSYVPIKVDVRVLELTSASEKRIDNGKPLQNSTFTITQGSLVNGHILSAKAIGYIDYVGSVDNEFDLSSITIKDRNGNDVISNYFIKLVAGSLTITDPNLD
jgi:hypothetical protein